VSGIRGDFDGLRELREKLHEVARGKLKPAISRAAGEAALTELRQSFRRSRDPYGRSWAKLVIRTGGKPLRDTGILANSFSVQPTANGFTVSSSIDYASPHQDGATIIPRSAKVLAFKAGRGSKQMIFAHKVKLPARKMMPDEGDLGTWAEPISEAIMDAFAGHFGGK
jgi:phage gpG-like protein